MTHLANARLTAHWAAQLPSAPGTTLLENTGDFSHTNLVWSADLQALVGQPVNGKSAALRIADLTLLVGDDVLELADHTYEHAMRWLGERFSAELHRSEHEMPSFGVADGAPFGRVEGLVELAGLFDRAHAALSTVGPPVRCWPHHFDMATLVDLGSGRSIGVGMSPGDQATPEAYWYVTPWPYPTDVSDLPVLSEGRWHTEGWVGAVLPGLIDPLSFLPQAVAACHAVLNRTSQEPA
ncbi:MAG: hypothetical protein ACI9MC_000641 [Kiritimatiellia bacterium]|jgi:hypothetical protein